MTKMKSKKTAKPRKLQVGDRVRYYGLMNPLQDLKGEAVIKAITPMHGGGRAMVWFEHGGSCWHPDACELADWAEAKCTS